MTLYLPAKVRRLYDIANILSSIHLIEKTYVSGDQKKPAFKWIGAPLASFVTSQLLVPAPVLPVDQPSPSSATSTLSNMFEETHVPFKKRKRVPDTPLHISTSTTSMAANNSPVPLVSPSTSTGLHFAFHSPPAKKMKLDHHTQVRAPLQPLVPNTMLVAPTTMSPVPSLQQGAMVMPVTSGDKKTVPIFVPWAFYQPPAHNKQ